LSSLVHCGLWPNKKLTNIQSDIPRDLLKLVQWTNNQIKFHSILFRMMCGFMAIQAIEMVEKGTRKKLTQEKTC